MKLPTGSLSCIYLILYSIGRFFIEGLRIDPLCIGSTPPFCEGGIRIAQILSISLVALGSLGLIWIYKCKQTLPKIRSLNGESN